MNRFICIVPVIAILSCDSKTEEGIVSYFPKVKTIIKTNCVSCHSVNGTGSPKGFPILLDTDDEIVAEASAIKSATIDPITVFNKRMPYGSELSQADKDIILKWYEKGGKASD